MHQLFSAFGNVKQTKIIQDRAGVSKGYGFVTFETEEEARRLQVQADNIVLKERKLNIAPAIKKQVHSHSQWSYSLLYCVLVTPSGVTPCYSLLYCVLVTPSGVTACYSLLHLTRS